MSCELTALNLNLGMGFLIPLGISLAIPSSTGTFSASFTADDHED